MDLSEPFEAGRVIAPGDATEGDVGESDGETLDARTSSEIGPIPDTGEEPVEVPAECLALQFTELDGGAVTPVRLRVWGDENADGELRVVGEGCPDWTAHTDAGWLRLERPSEDRVQLVYLGEPIRPTGYEAAAIELRWRGQVLPARVEVSLSVVQPAPPEATPRVLVVGVEGLGGWGERALGPTTRWLERRGSLSTRADAPGAGEGLASAWAAVLTGSDGSLHRVSNDGSLGADAPPTFAARVFDSIGRGTLAAVSAPGGVRVLLTNGAQAALTLPADREALDHALAGDEYSVFFVQVPVGDALGAIDALIGALIDRTLQRPAVADEAWTVIIFGLTPTQDVARGPLLVAGANLVAERGVYSLFDVHPTVTAAMGVHPGPDEGLTGEARGAAAVEVCGDGRDNNGDGLIDCASPACAPRCDLSCVDINLGQETGARVIQGTFLGGRAAPPPTCRPPGPEGASFYWVAPANDEYLFYTPDSDFETILSARLDDCDAREAACADTWPSESPIELRAPAEWPRGAIRMSLRRGQGVVLALDRPLSGDGGLYVLGITGRAALCAASPRLDGPLPVRESVSNRGAPTAYAPSCSATAYDVVRRFVAREQRAHTIVVRSEAFVPTLSIFGAGCAPIERACRVGVDVPNGREPDVTEFGAELRLNLNAGEEITVVVSSREGLSVGDFVLEIR